MSTGEIIRTKFMNNIWMVICNNHRPKETIQHHQDKNLVVDWLTVKSNLRTKTKSRACDHPTTASLI